MFGYKLATLETKIETGSAIIIINMELVGVLGLTPGLDTTG